MEQIWTEKYRPETFEQLSFSQEVAIKLQNLIEAKGVPHIILYGKDGSGKRTRINCLLSSLYSKQALKTYQDTFVVKNNSGNNIEVNIRASKYHVEIDPSDAEHNDRIVLNKLIKESSQNILINNNNNNKNDFMSFVIYQAEKLTFGAQAALRRTMEKYSQRIRIFMICQSTGSIIPAIKSRCLMIRLPSPQIQDIAVILQTICQQEGIRMGEEVLQEISERSCNNLRKAILMLQTGVLTKNYDMQFLEEKWKQIIGEKIVSVCLGEQSVEVVKRIRVVLFELLVNQVPGKCIIKEVLYQLVVQVRNEEMILEIKELAANCDKMISGCDKEIIHLENFIVGLLVTLQKYKFSKK